jgi:hypothetical protein
MKAAKIYAIHMFGLLIVSIILGLTIETEVMWIFGGFGTFFMTGFHLSYIVREVYEELKK